MPQRYLQNSFIIKIIVHNLQRTRHNYQSTVIIEFTHQLRRIRQVSSRPQGANDTSRSFPTHLWPCWGSAGRREVGRGAAVIH